MEAERSPSDVVRQSLQEILPVRDRYAAVAYSMLMPTTKAVAVVPQEHRRWGHEFLSDGRAVLKCTAYDDRD
jgi:hypothetical protein